MAISTNIPTNKAVKQYMFDEISLHPELFIDCGEVNCTKLAEDAADNFSDYENGSEIPERYFEIAFAVSQVIERNDTK